MLEEAEGMADYVIIDSPPLSDVVDALQLARHVDAVLVVARLGHSRINKIRQLAELLAGNGIRPVGFALIGAPRSGRQDYGYYSREPDRQLQTESSLSTR